MFELDHLELAFPGRRLLRPTTRRVGGTRLTLLRGPSGCGKSTLLRVLAGLGRPSGGNLSCQGRPLLPGALARHRRRVHLVDQQPLLPGATLREALVLGQVLRGMDPAPADRLAAEMDALGLRRELDAEPGGLSGGERLRAAVLRGLLLPLDCLLLDEPSAGLDAEAAALLRERLARPGTPVLLVASHDPAWREVGDACLEWREETLHDA